MAIVKRIFSNVTQRYDFLNHFLSLRRDIAWRRFLVKRLHFFSTFRLLDLATGTGDVAIGAALAHSKVRVAAVDFVQSMLEEAEKKVARAGLGKQVMFSRGDAMNLPFSEGVFDAVTVAFGIRNMPDRHRVLKEMHRVLVPGGAIFLLEMTSPQNQVFRVLYLPYLKTILPRLARWFTKDPAAYLYLAESIIRFPKPDELAEEIRQAGFAAVKKFPLTLGITYLHEGIKPG